MIVSPEAGKSYQFVQPDWIINMVIIHAVNLAAYRCRYFRWLSTCPSRSALVSGQERAVSKYYHHHLSILLDERSRQLFSLVMKRCQLVSSFQPSWLRCGQPASDGNYTLFRVPTITSNGRIPPKRAPIGTRFGRPAREADRFGFSGQLADYLASSNWLRIPGEQQDEGGWTISSGASDESDKLSGSGDRSCVSARYSLLSLLLPLPLVLVLVLVLSQVRIANAVVGLPC